MSQTTYCTNCGKEISITARFCRFCGSPIRRSQTDSSTPISTSRSPSVYTPPPQPTRAAQPEPIEKIPDSVVEALYARKRKTQIKTELKSLLKEVDELSKKVEIGLIDDAESSSQTSELQEKMGKLQEEQKSLATQPLELESLSEEEKKWSERLEKLSEKNRAGAVSPAVYDSLKDEYSAELATKQRKIATEERKARRWLVDLQKETRELETKVESLRVRSEIEGQKDADIVQKIENFRHSRVKKALAAEVLTEILQNLN
jgi:hypothetical protein